MIGKAVEIDIASDRYRKGSKEGRQKLQVAENKQQKQKQNQEQEHENPASR